MTKSTSNAGKNWSKQDEQRLKDLASKNTPTRVIGIKLGRTENSIQSKASELDLSLKPTNRSPYGTKSKK